MMNPVFRRVAPRAPGFGLIVHRGRKSGQEYRTPVNVFPNGNDFIVALTYGRESEWVRNVLANGGCTLVTRGQSIPLTQPKLIHDTSRQTVPGHVRPMLGLLKVNDFLELQRVGGG
jgi:deazaflavin-dependent oxidoreductase (nitroreductase family)